ncbi:hypothetical protein [Xanthomonas rydalmerensis]|uniref:Uncharacterized protein n=1 Tax=Xanthomonas rydalmerensis TaxID=3046274 RepID=A0ABZ0JHJ6_9XANT|nr:hypothetical protein [Xanthomonas sp. DM-2023]WOS39154.1 hypothetical protein QN243_11935 [Xanthomonas sp. DM-2023]WOS43337.1 hypothetical protein QN242_11935 [Xanthomonas sp. DM-2023]WOS47517.1 hypothetical protein QN240_11935 [Xanthomonas sp. DM-2023]WOS51697.1 hypothetical protein QN244_11935 [Xanthomonas sp. DM-2023]WOS55880.1 hypothetical protein QN245_11935 [Xanthomonas sp. DM-2023]
MNENKKNVPNTGTEIDVEHKATAVKDGDSESEKDLKPAGFARWQCWPKDARDGWRLLVALAVIVIAAFAGLVPVPGKVDPYSRVNLIVLGLVVASWIVGLCSSVSPRMWASVFGVSGLAIWFAGIYFSADGVAKALLDMVTFW